MYKELKEFFVDIEKILPEIGVFSILTKNIRYQQKQNI